MSNNSSSSDLATTQVKLAASDQTKQKAYELFCARIEKLRANHARIIPCGADLKVYIRDFEIYEIDWAEAMRVAVSSALFKELSDFRKTWAQLEVYFNGRLILCFQ